MTIRSSRGRRTAKTTERHRPAQSSPDRHTRGGIPIPSFSIGTSQPPRNDSDEASSFTPTSQWNNSLLLRAEAALQLHLSRQTGKLLPLDDFYALANKLALAQSANNETEQATTVQRRNSKLSREERLLFDLLCVASPSLYRLVKASLDESSSAPADAAKVRCLEVARFPGNRMEEFRRLLNRQKPSASNSEMIMENILSHRAASGPSQPLHGKTKARQNPETEEPSVPSQKTSKKVILEPYIKPDMNLEERVRARAEARKDRNKESHQTSDDGTNTKVDRTALVRLADALWSHTRHVMLRQKQMESSMLRRTKVRPSTMAAMDASDVAQTFSGSFGAQGQPRNCVMTLKDVVQTFSGSGKFGSSGNIVPSQATRREKVSQGQIVEALRELQRLEPGWITLVDPQQKSGKKGRLSKHATVWIKHIDYQDARRRLCGGGDDPKNSNVSKPPIGKRPPPDADNIKKAPPSAGTKGAQRDAPSKKASSAKARAWVVSVTPKSHVELGKKPPNEKAAAVSTPPVTKRARTVTSQLHLHNDSNTATSKPVAGTKRSAEHAASGKTPKKRRGLRINQHLILTDADYDGGEVIQSTPDASPRGLKSLFSQLNSGQRI